MITSSEPLLHDLLVERRAASGRQLKVMVLDPAGSSAHVSHNLCNHLSALGCDVHVFTAPHWLRVTKDCRNAAYQTHVCFYRGTQIRSYEAQTGIARRFWRLARFLQHVKAMTSICFQVGEFDLVHTQILPLPAVDYLFLRVIARRTPIVCTVHELVPHKSKHRRLTGSLFKAIYRLARVLFVYTDYTRKRLIRELELPPQQIMDVPHGGLEHLLELEPAPASTVADETPIILFLGNIRPDKGVDTLINAAWHLRKTVPRFKVVVAGTPGFDMTDLRQLAVRLGLEDFVEFRLGYMPEPEFAAWLSRATVVALPYRRVEQSGVAIAACTLGKALVATRCGGLEELITEAGNGLLVPVGDPVALAGALGTLLSNREARETCELRSRDYARTKLSWDSIASRTLAGYKAAVEQCETVGQGIIAERP